MSPTWSLLADRIRAHLGALLESTGEIDEVDPFGAGEPLPDGDFAEEEDWYESGEDAWDEEEAGEDRRRLCPPDRIVHPEHFPEALAPAGTEWVDSIRDLVEQPALFPESMRGSRVRIQYLLDAGPDDALAILAEYLSTEDVQHLLMHESDRLMVLLETLSMFRAEALRALRSLTDLFGAEFVRSLLMAEIDRFIVEGAHLVSPLEMFAGLAHAIAFAGPRLHEILARAARRDLERGGKSLLSHRARQFEERYRLFSRHGPAATRLTEIFGADFVRRRLLSAPGRDIASELLDLGCPIWEDILRVRLGVEAFRRRVVDDPEGLAQEVRDCWRIPDSELLREALGPDLVERLLQSGPKGTIRMCVLGFLVGLGHRRPDDPSVFSTLPWEFGKLLASVARNPLFTEGVVRLEGSDGPIARLARAVVRLDTLGIPPVRETVLPLLRSPDRADALIEAYLEIRERMSDLDGVAPTALSDRGTVQGSARWIFHGLLADRGIRVSRRAFSRLIERAAKHHAAGATIPALPAWAAPFDLEVPEIVAKRDGDGETEAILAVQAEVLGLASRDDLAREWWKAFELSRSLGLRLPGDTLAAIRNAVREGRTAQVGRTGFPPLWEFLVSGRNRELAELMFRLALGDLLLRDEALLRRLRSGEPAELAEALYELLTERFPNEHGPAAEALAEALEGHPSEALSFAALEEAHPGSAVSPLHTRSYRQLRRSVEKELAKSRHVATGRRRKVRLTPFTGLLNLFAGIHGEDCSATVFHVGRIFSPGHVFHLIQTESEETLRGYVLSVPVRIGADLALHIDAVNPANSLSFDPVHFLRGVFDHLSIQAERGGFCALLATCHDAGISNRSRIQEAAGKLLADAEAIQEVQAMGGMDGFQVPTVGGARVIWKR